MWTIDLVYPTTWVSTCSFLERGNSSLKIWEVDVQRSGMPGICMPNCVETIAKKKPT